jgi:hypothetical protein
VNDNDKIMGEKNCSICGELSPIAKAATREELFVIPLREPVCDGCLMAFWRNVLEAAKREPMVLDDQLPDDVYEKMLLQEIKASKVS